ncbi:TetR/AcrR family transcriptional regulator [Caulobacter sp. 17J65-9]|uniref:TetR/AcrR family transcriptional regulator n=1 Tax=Caulobacter sp. 17J65-9 TaxID=2709382 RepID=UPI0013C93D7D|nr:TetR/AcrR family transcriptional regulator [Caulobacter sp. 17J65-9]NEX91470.1 TetR/AcrR family transcriptional regulator [Caulobacter sp. 17J65-9]
MPIEDERDARSERKRQDVLDAARRRFMTEGYASTGMEAVARDAGVSTATLYAYFPSKSDLFHVVVEEAAEVFMRRAGETAHVQGDGATQLRAFALAYARFISDPFVRAIFRLVAAERRRFETVARRFHTRLRDEFGGVLIGILRRLHAEGRVSLTKPSWAAGQLMGMIEHPTFLVPLVAGDDAPVERPLEDICEEAVETFLARYGVRDGVGAEAA